MKNAIHIQMPITTELIWEVSSSKVKALSGSTERSKGKNLKGK